ncbi:MAG TPA: trypsin-like peptidase domain-containing protein [Vicinamibacteria bacterium]|nr:trypsin-like peptidase domain-containing protein [Vicinamibacteria bacterium]HRB13479.1 trypsin-like peptidase domain-containing protein [Vicinamibacteria bacterium]
MRLGRVFFPALLLGAALGAYFGRDIKEAVSGPSVAEAQTRPEAGSKERNLDADERATIALFKESQAAVAFITTTEQQIDFWSRTVSEQATGSGSGFVWDDNGHIVTNYHVVQPVAEGSRGAEITVTLQDKNLAGTLVGVAPELDLAVIRVETSKRDLKPLAVGASANLEVGQKVFAIGNPFGLDHTLTTGIVSALGRTITSVLNTPIEDVIQTDAAINPGNSGGPLLDSSGRLIGVNTAIYSPSGANAGIGFAVPVDTVSRVVPQLIQFGKMRRPVIGVRTDARLDSLVARRFGVRGAVILDVEKGSAAARAGLTGIEADRSSISVGDVITEIDGKPVTGQADLSGRLSYIEPGATVNVKVWRDGKVREVKLTLGATR